jgi:hypothetical protein
LAIDGASGASPTFPSTALAFPFHVFVDEMVQLGAAHFLFGYV